MSIDLHTHTTASDGTMTPTELVRYARRKGLTAIAITDHDTIAGIGEAIAAGKAMGIEVVPGVELSVKLNGSNVHLLGYLFDCQDGALLDGLAKLQQGRLVRNQQILAKLQALGLDIDFSELPDTLGQGQHGRPHIAELMIGKGFVRSIDEAFARYLGRGAAAYAPRFVFGAEEGIALIRNAGGLAVLAHPVQLGKPLDELPGIIDQLHQLGLEGIEVYYPNHSKKLIKALIALAGRYRLLLTGGSDYHGNIRPGTTLAGGRNVTVPAQLLAAMKLRLEDNGRISP